MVGGAVVVKFSPRGDGALGRRVADLLIAEHLAHRTVVEHGRAAPNSAILAAEGRIFLEVERFDRRGMTGRTGQTTLESLDQEHLGSDMTRWESAAAELAGLGVVPLEAAEAVHWLALFGRLLGNTDMHFGNLSFLLDGSRPLAVAPAYDMLPMHYYPRHQELPSLPFPLPELTAADGAIAADAITAAEYFWCAVAGDNRISPEFSRIASDNARRVTTLRGVAGLLPVG